MILGCSSIRNDKWEGEWLSPWNFPLLACRYCASLSRVYSSIYSHSQSFYHSFHGFYIPINCLMVFLCDSDSGLFHLLLHSIQHTRERFTSDKRLDLILLGGFLGSVYSLCQFIVSPWIGSLSDRFLRLMLDTGGNAS
jgi:hypothetical protein